MAGERSMTEPGRPGAGAFGALHHIGIVVRSTDAASENVCALLGGEVVAHGRDEELSVSWVWIASKDNPIFEVLAPSANRGPIARHLETHGPGLHHVSFQPTTLDGALAHVRRCCLEVIGENRSHGGYEEFFVDPKATGGALFHSFRELESSD
jgi:methylmalonyl-CoA/ethylmalonyl-CoA epimerase